ncbi:MAG: hypothetical protein GWN53_17280 [Gammaproteobacteria bacterium]|uniref:Uncharacterized protein n=1 Tax=Candidatus Kutchimonas denitrificans TaxID=3056748 RepID=A0AAE4ZCB6_9BACT|nr:hypothetical protein [Candidatus Kutchimonas denitrificans]NIV53595.1 hypothetical protein [Gammaproteobacteria bacterium]
MATHESLNPAERSGSSSDTNGRWIPIAGRVGKFYPWDVTVNVGNVQNTGDTVDVTVEAALTRDNDDVVTLATFSQFTTPNQANTTITVSGYFGRGYLRSVATINGTVTVGTTEEAPLFSVDAEKARLTKQVQNWDDVKEAAARAEAELIDPYRMPAGRYALYMDRHGFGENIRDAIATQIERRFQLWALSKSNDASQVVTRRQMDAIDPEAKRKVKSYSALGPTYF